MIYKRIRENSGRASTRHSIKFLENFLSNNPEMKCISVQVSQNRTKYGYNFCTRFDFLSEEKTVKLYVYGLSFGYSGEGPRGLVSAMNLVGFKIDLLRVSQFSNQENHAKKYCNQRLMFWWEYAN